MQVGYYVTDDIQGTESNEEQQRILQRNLRVVAPEERTERGAMVAALMEGPLMAQRLP